MRLAPLLCALLCAAPAAAQRLVRAPAPPLGEPCDDLDAAELAAAIEREAPLLRELSSPGARFGRRLVRPAEYAERTLAPLARLARRGRAALCAELPRRFQFYRLDAGAAGRFTAYYHPELRGSRRRHGPYLYPLYRRPADAALAHLTTAQILGGGLDGRDLELLWLDDAAAAWSAHIEGSARVVLDDGGAVNLTTDGHNGWDYVNVSRLVLRDGKLPRGQAPPPGMTRLQRFFQEHPDELRAYWAQNPHFVFFRETPLQGTGKFGELVPGRSLAVDPRHVPLGAAVWIRTEQPGAERGQYVPLRRIGLAQDVGAAIAGPGRVDVFFGAGPEAQVAAAAMNRPGELYVLLVAERPKRVIKYGHALPDRARHGRIERHRPGAGAGPRAPGDARRAVRAAGRRSGAAR